MLGRELLLTIVVCAVAGCSADTQTSTRRPGSGSGGSDGFGNVSTGGAGAASGSGAAGFGNPTGNGGTGGMRVVRKPGDPNTCGGETHDAEGRPLDIFVIMDESLSMIVPVDIWGPTSMALNAFFSSPDTTGISAGIGFFSAGCDVAAYQVPVVPVAELPGNAMPLQMALAARLPGVGTATTPALQGALAFAAQRQMQTPDHKQIVLLVTDGEPVTCGSTVQTTADAAAAGLAGTPSIPTYVLGLGNVGGLDQMAQAGGTNKAFVVSDPMQVQSVIDAMNQIRATALPCEYRVPDAKGGVFVKNQVNLSWTSAGTTSTIPYVGGVAKCDPTQGGWYYDNLDAPTQLIACDFTCVQFKTGGSVSVVLGCPQQGLE
jgi:hypothetical protein